MKIVLPIPPQIEPVYVSKKGKCLLSEYIDREYLDSSYLEEEKPNH